MYPQDVSNGGTDLNRDDQISLDFTEWIDRTLDGTITAEQFAALDNLIATNEEACIYYQEFITTYVGLMDLQGVLPKTFDISRLDELSGSNTESISSGSADYFDPYYFDPDETDEEKKRRIEMYASEQLDAYLREQYKNILLQESRKSGLDLWGATNGIAQTVGAFLRTGSKVVKATAVCLLVVLLCILIFSHLKNTFTPKKIATLNTSLQAKFAGDKSFVPGTRLASRQDPLYLQTGLIEIVFDDGAKVLLEAPAAFYLKSGDSMILHSGQLFATVPGFAKGFTVATPNSRIIDMGTEFGIRVEQDGTSNLHMFKGHAALSSDSGDESERMMLTAGQARHIDISGQISDIPIKEEGFVRHFYSETGFVWRGQKLCLVDIAGMGNGLGTGRENVYLDPVEGYRESYYCNKGGNEYHRLVSNLFIDGLFIPDGNRRQVISSQGHEFADCPQTNGECYTNLGVNPKQRVWATDMRTGIVKFNGQDYGVQSHPCIVMHANLGITFDLYAIRSMCPDIKMIRFVSKIGIADFEENAGCNADFWVLVDGDVRFSRRNITQKNILSDVSVELGSSDRFLTLVTTDGGDVDRMGAYQRSYTCDWCVFVEPALVLETTDDLVGTQAR
ncbi:MAG: NPCBM/NEW2 domain-containing protein [Sedimentisphaerales bacterium]|nr:NPCBM/NEW2 domain-containing protein [Sedimentisphaerales bacterium]